MTYTVATMTVSRATHAEIKRRLEDAGYDHAIDPDGMLDMTHIALVQGEEATHNDAIIAVCEEAFRAGYAVAKHSYESIESAWGNFTPSQHVIDILHQEGND